MINNNLILDLFNRVNFDTELENIHLFYKPTSYVGLRGCWKPIPASWTIGKKIPWMDGHFHSLAISISSIHVYRLWRDWQ